MPANTHDSRLPRSQASAWLLAGSLVLVLGTTLVWVLLPWLTSPPVPRTEEASAPPAEEDAPSAGIVRPLDVPSWQQRRAALAAQQPGLEVLPAPDPRHRLGGTDGALIREDPLLRKELAAAIRQKGGIVERDAGRPDGSVVSVSLAGIPEAVNFLVGLRGLLTLRDLSLADTPVRDDDLAALASLPALRHLDLRRARIGDAGLQHLQRLAQLENLNLADTKVSGAGLKGLEKLHRLRRLDLEGTEVGDAGLASLRRLGGLRSLRLGYVGVSDRGLKVLLQPSVFWPAGLSFPDLPPDYRSPFPDLEELYLDRNRLTDASISLLATLRSLRTLDLRCEGVRGLDLSPLCTLPHLETVRLPAPALADDVLRTLGRAGKLHLLGCAHRLDGLRPRSEAEVAVLDLARTLVTDDGLVYLGGLTNLRSLDLDRTQVSSAGLEHLRAFPQLGQLLLRETRVSPVGLRSLKPLRQLHTLRISSSCLTDEALRALGEVGLVGALGEREGGQVVRLDLHQTPIGDEGLKHLGSLVHLRCLLLSRTKVTDAGLEHLRSLRRLEQLELNRTSVRGPGLVALRPLRRLRALGLDREQLTDETLRALAEIDLVHMLDQARGSNGLRPGSAAEIVRMSLQDTTVGDEGLRALRALAGLRELDLRRTFATAEGLSHLRGCTQLRFLAVEGALLNDVGLRHLAAAGVLHALHKRAKGAGDAQPATEAEVISLNLAETTVGDEGLAHLQGLTGLRELDLSGTRVGDGGLSFLRKRRALETLNLTNTKVGEVGLLELAPLRRLRTLRLSASALTDEALQALGDAGLLHALEGAEAAGGGAPETAADVVKLRLNWAPLAGAGLSALSACPNLRTLDLGDTDLKDGLTHLPDLPKLRLLDLRGTHINAEEVKDLQRRLPGLTVRR